MASYIVRLLWSRGITLEDIAKEFGVSRQFVSMAITRQRNSKKARQIRRYVQKIIKEE